MTWLRLCGDDESRASKRAAFVSERDRPALIRTAYLRAQGARVMKVNPDLMRATTVKNAFNQTHVGSGPDDSVIGLCLASPPC